VKKFPVPIGLEAGWAPNIGAHAKDSKFYISIMKLSDVVFKETEVNIEYCGI
jgi:hypothetical protein